MSHFKAEMHQIQFRLGSAPDPAGGTYSAPPCPLAGFKGALLLREGREWERRGGREARRKEGEGRVREKIETPQ